MKQIKLMATLSLLVAFAAPNVYADTVAGEKAIFAEMKAAIPANQMVTVDDLYAKLQDIQAGKCKAEIIDIRTRDEFETGHILGSNNIDSGHAYTIPKKWADPDTEMWVFCRTQHRATYFVGMLHRYGYHNVYLVQGGIKAWAEKGYPLFNTYLGEIKVVQYAKQLKEEYEYREGH